MSLSFESIYSLIRISKVCQYFFKKHCFIEFSVVFIVYFIYICSLLSSHLWTPASVCSFYIFFSCLDFGYSWSFFFLKVGIYCYKPPLRVILLNPVIFGMLCFCFYLSEIYSDFPWMFRLLFFTKYYKFSGIITSGIIPKPFSHFWYCHEHKCSYAQCHPTFQCNCFFFFLTEFFGLHNVYQSIFKFTVYSDSSNILWDPLVNFTLFILFNSRLSYGFFL